MIIVEDAIISDDIVEKQFICNIEKCKGACCIEGDLGAPLEMDELAVFEEIYEKVKPYLSKEGIAEIEEQGVYVKDFEGDFSTPTIGDKECAYAVYDKENVLQCGIEQAYNDGLISYRKPMSCYLYPIRVKKFGRNESLNYDKWDICSDACSLGEKLGVPIYKFLKDPLIQKYGEGWYEKLEKEVDKLDK